MIKYCLSAVRHLQVNQGRGCYRIQEMARLQLKQVLEGVKRIQASEKGSPEQNLYQLLQIYCSESNRYYVRKVITWDVTMLWAAVSLCFLHMGKNTPSTADEFSLMHGCYLGMCLLC